MDNEMIHPLAHSNIAICTPMGARCGWTFPMCGGSTARGDYAGFIGREKTDGLSWSTRYGAWGDYSFQDGANYTWNAQWGYRQSRDKFLV